MKRTHGRVRSNLAPEWRRSERTCRGALASATRRERCAHIQLRWCLALNFRTDGMSSGGIIGYHRFCTNVPSTTVQDYIHNVGQIGETKGNPDGCYPQAGSASS